MYTGKFSYIPGRYLMDFNVFFIKTIAPIVQVCKAFIRSKLILVKVFKIQYFHQDQLLKILNYLS